MNTRTALFLTSGVLLLLSPLLISAAPAGFKVLDDHKLRSDPAGHGGFQASRGGRKHAGVDLLVRPGQKVYAPIDGQTRRAIPYRDDTRYQGIAIKGTGKYQGLEVKIFYMLPDLSRSHVQKGSVIGKGQAISRKYSSTMKDHLHIEIRINGQLIDPTSYLL